MKNENKCIKQFIENNHLKRVIFSFQIFVYWIERVMEYRYPPNIFFYVDNHKTFYEF